MVTVYGTSLAVEAQLIHDLLGRAGISSRIDGQYLQGAAGELPLGELVRVCVEQSDAAEARHVIAEWELSQPKTPQSPPPRGSWTPFAFLIGSVLGAFCVWWFLNTPMTRDGVDYDGDGNLEERFYYSGGKTTRVEFDRNADGKTDARYEYDSHGLPVRFMADDDFDGKYESAAILRNGQASVESVDRNDDGFTEEILRYEHGVLVQRDILDPRSGIIAKRQHFGGRRLTSIEADLDRNGQFDRRIELDEFGDPK